MSTYIAPESHEFLVSSVWRRCREDALRRDKYMCQTCLKKGRITLYTDEAPLEVHHIISRKERPDLSLELSNLISLCHDCHEETKQRTRTISKRGIRIIKI